MEMKIAYKDILSNYFIVASEQVMQKELPIKLSSKIAKIIKKIHSEKEHFESEKKSHGIKLGGTIDYKKNIFVFENQENEKIFYKEIQDFMESTFDLNVEKIKPEELIDRNGKEIELNPIIFVGLDMIFEI